MFISIYDKTNLTFIGCFDKYIIQLGHRNVILYHTFWTYNDPGKKVFENILEKGENADNQHFLLFPQ